MRGNMQIRRMFTTEQVKGSRRYLDTQKKYELLRTALYFFLPLALFFAGIVQTQASLTPGEGNVFSLLAAGLSNPKSRVNLLSIVAVLGLLPASKSLVGTIMFFRFDSLREEAAEQIAAHCKTLCGLYDCVFTSYRKNFEVGHLAVRGKTVCGYTEQKDFAEKEFYRHLEEHLRLDGHKDVSVKIFTDLDKYTARLEQMEALEEDRETTASILATLKSILL